MVSVSADVTPRSGRRRARRVAGFLAVAIALVSVGALVLRSRASECRWSGARRTRVGNAVVAFGDRLADAMAVSTSAAGWSRDGASMWVDGRQTEPGPTPGLCVFASGALARPASGGDAQRQVRWSLAVFHRKAPAATFTRESLSNATAAGVRVGSSFGPAEPLDPIGSGYRQCVELEADGVCLGWASVTSMVAGNCPVVLQLVMGSTEHPVRSASGAVATTPLVARDAIPADDAAAELAAVTDRFVTYVAESCPTS